MEFDVLIQRNLPPRMLVTVDVAATPAVVSPLPQAEAFLTYWRVAYCGNDVQFPVRAVGEPGHGRKVVGGYGAC